MAEFKLDGSKQLHLSILNISRNSKKVIMGVADFFAILFAIWSAYALRLTDWWPEVYLIQALPLFIAVPTVGLLIFNQLGLYRVVIRFMGLQGVFVIVKGVFILAALLWLGAALFNVSPFPRSVPVIFIFCALIYLATNRLIIQQYYQYLQKHYVEREPVLIYGAGGAGAQLASALATGTKYLPVAFLDDDSSLWKSTVYGLVVCDPASLDEMVREYGVSSVLLALPSISKTRRREVLEMLSEYGVHVKTVPSMSDIISGESVDKLRDVEPADLLGRDSVPPDPSLLSASITNKVVLVSGAGGSIGSEICRQIIKNQPKILILYEINEFSLYSIEAELSRAVSEEKLEIEIIPILGSVLDQLRVDRLLSAFRVNTVYHAAAYKHVPMVEHNIFEGVQNNAFGTKVFAEAAVKHGVERFVLISTDKAVRPTNVMGATKRLAELILQDMAQAKSNTVFSMVRFGNVLGSSGSVVPLFSRQIKDGGPVTVTHPEITRFFMTIPEAASLVIQAGSMAEGGDVFVLDMGQPVKITQLAERMIKLMGYDINYDGSESGIEIVYTGLRPGEKLYEELLIGDNVLSTKHPKIMRAKEERLNSQELEEVLNDLLKSLEGFEGVKVYSLLSSAVSGFKPDEKIVDWLSTKHADVLNS